MTAFWRQATDGVTLAVKVQPKSRRPGLQGRAPDVDGVRLRIGVAEAAEDGRANRAVCRMVAGLLGVAESAVSVRQGAGSRRKTLRAEGDPESLVRVLAALETREGAAR